MSQYKTNAMSAWSYTLRRKLQEYRRAASHVRDAWSKARWLRNSKIINSMRRADCVGGRTSTFFSRVPLPTQPTQGSPLLHSNLIASGFTRPVSFHRTQQQLSNILISTIWQKDRPSVTVVVSEVTMSWHRNVYIYMLCIYLYLFIVNAAEVI